MPPSTYESFIWQGPGTITAAPFNETVLAKVERAGFLRRGDRFDVEGHWFRGCYGTLVEREHHDYHVRLTRGSHEVVTVVQGELDANGVITEGAARLMAENLAGQEWLAAFRQRQS